MKLWKWEKGRQSDCEYWKLPIYSFKIWGYGFDCYVLKYSENQVLPEHKDPVENGKHWRLNIGWGFANFCCKKLIFGKRFGKLTIFLFRPDLYSHSLYIFEKTFKLSFGFVKFIK